MLQVILVCHQSVPISGSCWGSVLGALGEVCRSLLSWGGVASAPWCKSQVQGTSLRVGRKEQLVLLGGSKALLWRCFDPGTEWGERERRSREGRWGHPSWEGSSSSLFSWSSIYPSRAGGASRKLHEQERFGFLLGHCSCILCFSLCITGDSEEIQVAHRFFSQPLGEIGFVLK